MKKDNTHHTDRKGPIAWMILNPVAANLLMLILLIGGLIIGPTIKMEVFPEFSIDMVTISVPYPGASPAEVERSIILAVEEAVRSIDGVDEVNSTANEGIASIAVSLITGTDGGQALQDIKSAIDRITTIPEDAERPVVSLVVSRKEVLTLVLYGCEDQHVLANLAEFMREELLAQPEITYAEISGVRPYEISIEVPQSILRSYGLTMSDIANEIKQAALEIPGGGIKTKGGEILLRTGKKRYVGSDFYNITLISKSDGTSIKLGQIANIVDGFSETDMEATFNGKPAALVKIYRVGDETPVEVARAVKRYMKKVEATLPDDVALIITDDWSKTLEQRIDLLLRNAALGLILVLLVLGTFLEIRLAFWVTMGIPTSIIGSALTMALFGVSINMISLFAFILTLGIVVDDAIVVGENIYEKREECEDFESAAIEGTIEVNTPVTFSVLTNIAAFLPMLFMTGIAGKLFGIMPAIIIPVFVISLVESLLILPSHLAHQKAKSSFLPFQLLSHLTGYVDKALKWFIKNIYTPVQLLCLRFRYITVAAGISVLILVASFVAGGRIDFRFMPMVEGDKSIASVELAYGIPIEQTRKVTERLIESATKVLKKLNGWEQADGILCRIGTSGGGGGPVNTGSTASGSHIASLTVFLSDIALRTFTAGEFTKLWREEFGNDTPGIEKLLFKFNIGPSAGEPIDVEISHESVAILETAATEIAETLATYDGLKDIDDGFSSGKPQLDFRLTDEARAFGLRPSELGRQIRNSFYGAEALRQQRGRNEVRVMVRLPEAERQSEYFLEQLLIKLPAGGEIPLEQAVKVNRGNSYTVIKRRNGRRVLHITADVKNKDTNVTEILNEIKTKTMPEFIGRYRGLSYSFEGEQKEIRESMESLVRGFGIVLVMLYALLAIPFGSYIQPIVIMVAIPFGIVGAILGHVIMGYALSVISVMGIVALAGVVINDSLVLIDQANINYTKGGMIAFDAVSEAGQRRLRPIMLTSVTTFFGLAPMIFETSVQARFLIPMAISLGYGILFATGITLLLVPCFYLLVDDFGRVITWIRKKLSWFTHD
jgi:multidrug efflux pump subunit AcrB